MGGAVAAVYQKLFQSLSSKVNQIEEHNRFRNHIERDLDDKRISYNRMAVNDLLNPEGEDEIAEDLGVED